MNTRFLKISLYQLQKEIGRTVTLVIPSTDDLDLETGEIVNTPTRLTINKAVVLPKITTRAADYHRIFVAAGPNFTTGAMRDDVSQLVIIGRDKLPSGFKSDANHRFEFDNTYYMVAEHTIYADGAAFIYALAAIQGQTNAPQ